MWDWNRVRPHLRTNMDTDPRRLSRLDGARPPFAHPLKITASSVVTIAHDRLRY